MCRTTLVACLVALLPPLAGIPPPCTEEELLQSSDIAVEGYVVEVACGEARDSGECAAETADFLPELVSDCIATVAVTRVLKGDPGDEVAVPFLKLIRSCDGGLPGIPGSPKWDFRRGSRIRFYRAEPCRWSNIFELEAPFVRGDFGGDGEVDVSDVVAVLIHLFAGGPPPSPASAADADADGAETLSDAVFVLRYLFSGGAPPPPPFFRPAPAVTVSVGYDNYVLVDGLESDWGFSCVIETATTSVVLDSGASGARLLDNLEVMGVDASSIRAVVFSHSHEDHVGGREQLLEALCPVPVFLPESFPPSFRDDVASDGCSPLPVRGPLEIVPGIRSSGELPGSPVEQEVFVDTPAGLVVITPCAHAGILEIVREAKRQSGRDVHALIGGFHLFKEDEDSVREAVGGLRALGVRKVGPCHCSGDLTRELCREEFGVDFIDVGVGARIIFR